MNKEEIIKSIRNFNRYYVNTLGILENNLFDLKFTLTESRIVFEIDLNKGITARELKQKLKIDEGYLSRLINGLVKKTIIEKRQSKTDKRVSNLFVTENGKELLNEINYKSNLQIENLLKNLNKHDVQQLSNIMNDLRQIFEKIV